MSWQEIDEQVCSVARTLSILGDRWTMLIIRDLFLGNNKFTDLHKSLGITKHRLSDRLNRLVDDGIVSKVLYDESRGWYRYQLTEKGLELFPIIITITQWGDKWKKDSDGVPLQFVHKSCEHVCKPELHCNVCGKPIDAFSMKVKPGPGLLKKLARGESLDHMELLKSIVMKDQQ